MQTSQWNPVNLTASGVLKSGPGTIRGFYVASHTSGTVKIWNNTAASGTVLVNTITLEEGPQWVELGGLSATTGLYATLTGTADITFAVL